MSDIHKTMEAYLSMVSEKKLDPVNKKALNKDFDDREDKDIDNDGDVDSSDEYLHNRRKVVKKAMKKEEVKLGEANKTAVSHRAALQMIHNAGLQSEKAMKSAFDAIKKMKQPSKGYVYADDVDKLISSMKKTFKEEVESDKEKEDPKKKNPFPPKKDDDDDDEDEMDSDDNDNDDDEEEKPKVVGKKEKDKNPKTSDKTAEISKIGEAFDELWSAMQEAINQKKGATEPEKMDSKASPKEKEFASKHVADVKGVKGKKLSDADDPEKPSKTVKTEMKEFEVIRALLSGNPTGE